MAAEVIRMRDPERSLNRHSRQRRWL